MSLVEIARFADVYEADLAAAFLASHGMDVTLAERHQTTVDPLMQRAFGIRLMGPASIAAEARALLARVQAGEFAEPDDDDPAPDGPGLRSPAARLALAILGLGFGMAWGPNRPRRLRPVHKFGMGLIGALVAFSLWGWGRIFNLW